MGRWRHPIKRNSGLFPKKRAGGRRSTGCVVMGRSWVLCCQETKMSQIDRIGVSLEKELLDAFDGLIAKKGYPSRSEAIRDLVRQQISVERLSNPKAKAVAAGLLVYEPT